MPRELWEMKTSSIANVQSTYIKVYRTCYLKTLFIRCIRCTIVNHRGAWRFLIYTLRPHAASEGSVPQAVFVMSSLRLLFHSPQRNSVSDQGEVEGCAHMLLGNESFSVPTQPADSQQDTIAAMQATIRPHRLVWICSSGLGTLAKSWLSAHPGGWKLLRVSESF